MKQEKDVPSENGLPNVPIAIIGMSCIFPDAADLCDYWANIKNGVDSIKDVPSTHWQKDDYYDDDPKRSDRTYAARGGFIDPVDFNPLEFGITPNAVEATDTSQLLGLVMAKRALQDAGYWNGKEFDRDRVSVILGVTGTLELVIPLGARLGHPAWKKALKEAGVDDVVASEVVEKISNSYVDWQENSFPGLLGNVTAGRIANRLDLRGTNCVVDAACASSLSAMHMALLELSAGRSDMVITGGLDTFNDIFMYMCFSKTQVLSPTGDAKPFDCAGDGTILGEGLGMLVLKRLDDAERDNDSIYAVIRGVGTSSDGIGNAVYVPSSAGQARAIQDAYTQADLSPDSVELVEAHGTGTKIGDASEVRALTDIFSSNNAGNAGNMGNAGNAGGWCALGSVKSQIGHTKAAAGIAGLIKVVMALRHKVLPPTIKVDKPISVINDNDETPFYINTEARPWLTNDGASRRAGVSAFGFGGSNFHCVVEEYGNEKSGIDWDPNIEIICFSDDELDGIKARLRSAATDMTWKELASLAMESRAAFSPEHSCRLVAVVEKGKSDVGRILSSALEMVEREPGRESWSSPDGVSFSCNGVRGRLGVLFPGQGSQYLGMQRGLSCQFPQMQRVLTEANTVFAATSKSDCHKRLSDCIYPANSFNESTQEANEEYLNNTAIAQPAIGAVSLGMFNVLRHFGVRPDAIAGHSYGELTALCAASCFDSQALHRLSIIRGGLMADIVGPDGLPGAMIAVWSDVRTLAGIMEKEAVGLVIANKNAPDQTVLSGPLDEVKRMGAILSPLGIRHKQLAVSSAFHSPLMARIEAPFYESLQTIEFCPAGMPVFANRDAQPYTNEAERTRRILSEQLVYPVEFVKQIENMYESGVSSFLEVGPGNKLGGLVRSILSDKEHEMVSMDASSGRRSGVYDLALMLAHLASAGYPVEMKKWNAGLPVTAILDDDREKPSMVLSICGSNYVKPKKESPLDSVPGVDTQDHAASLHNAPEVDAEVDGRERETGRKDEELKQTGSSPSAVTSGIDSSLAQKMFNITNENMVALQRMQEQTANLHKQFLDNQQSALNSLSDLMEQQSQLIDIASGKQNTFSVNDKAAMRDAVPETVTAKAAESPSVGAPQQQGITDELPYSDLDLEDDKLEEDKREEERTEGAPRATDEVRSLLLSVVSEKTGYPIEMFDLDMSLDSDLGIDSIKRVEILSALQEALPNAPEIRPEHMGELNTLRKIVEFISECGDLEADRRDENHVVTDNTDEVLAILLEVVSEKTGYPAEMVGADMNLDSDLGIDSIKRVEILSALQERIPGVQEIRPDQMGRLNTINQIAQFISTSTTDGTTEDASAAERGFDETAEGGAGLDDRSDIFASIERSVLSPVVLEGRDKDRPFAIKDGAAIVITDDGTRLPIEIKTRLGELGYRSVILAAGDTEQINIPADIGGLVIVAPTDPVDKGFLMSAFSVLQKAASGLRRSGRNGGAFFVTVTRLDGEFGLNGLMPKSYPISGGLAGLTKTARHEWPEVYCKAMDVSADLDESYQTARLIVDELFLEGLVEVGISKNGRNALELIPRALPDIDVEGEIGSGDVIIIAGGARGVTAQVSLALAREFQPILILLGRSEMVDEPAWMKLCSSESDIKRAIVERSAERVPPLQIEERYRLLIANREIRENIARMEECGARVEYQSVDIRNADSIESIVLNVRKKYGQINGLIHGAGILADRLIEDKTAEQFDNVYTTKVTGLLNLLNTLTNDELKFIAMFSSFTGRYGRIGQVDYAVANEALNKIAQQQSRKRASCRVVSVNWGPWDGGMVTPALKEIFRCEDVDLIAPEVGAAYLIREMCVKADGPVEVVVMGRNGRHCKSEIERGGRMEDDFEISQEFELNTSRHPFLLSHVIDNRAVLPMAMMIEWAAQAALHSNPGLIFHGFDDLRVLKGITLERTEHCQLRLLTKKAIRDNGCYVVEVEMQGGGDSGTPVVHSRCRIVLTEKIPDCDLTIPEPARGEYNRGMDDAYVNVLFHGELFRGIKRIENCWEDGISALVQSAPAPDKWIVSPLRNKWLADPLALDCGFQMMILWCFEKYRAASLPCFAGNYRQYRKVLPGDGMRVIINVKKSDKRSATADITFLDNDGKCVARMEDYESVISSSLNSTFQKNRLCDQAVPTGVS